MNETDFSILQGRDRYVEYFNLLSKVFKILGRYYEKVASKSFESTAVNSYIKRLLHSIEILRIKHTYIDDLTIPLRIDLSASGFPNGIEFSNFVVDINRRDEFLRKYPPIVLLKQKVLDQLIVNHEDPIDLLAQLSLRTYFEKLVPENIFMPFDCGEIILDSENKDCRCYIVTWCCFDMDKNRPVIQIMTFEQDKHCDPLTDKESNDYLDFMRVLKSEGSLVPNLAVLGGHIDRGLESIHPKKIKRISLGPLYSPVLHADSEDTESKIMSQAIEKFCDEDDFVLFFKQEMLFSAEQRVSRSLLLAEKRREVFHVPTDDPNCFSDQCSSITKLMLIPHVLEQHIGKDIRENAPRVWQADHISYDKGGKVCGI